MRKADLYIRVSTDEQADKGYSQRDQEDRLRRYCEIKGIPVRDVYIEDHSAKSFKRPEWQKYLSNLRKTKNNKSGSIVLFTKWDRFSRNAGDAYQMINQLRTHGVEPVAIEQPLDLTIPENKIMLAFYLASPEVENDRRALNVFHGMRRAKKEGRYMGTAPLGYVNKITEDKKKYIAPHDFEAPILKWAFEQIASNNFNTEQIWRKVREKADGKGRFSKNNFWVAVRNPLYCGKIFIPPYKEEKGHFVKGLHEPLISEKLFADVQDILDGRKRVVNPKIVATEDFPLRGFLKCPNCDRRLSGSASKGRNAYYNYYHCTSSCGTRFKAEPVNEAFLKQLRYLSPKAGMVDVFIEAFIKDFNNQNKIQNTQRASIISEIDALNKRYQNALLKNADGEMADDDFQEVKKLTKGKIEKLERQLNDLAVVGSEIKDLVASALKKVANIDRRYENGDIEEKRAIIGSMFPEFLEFDGTQHRTARLNSAITLIYQNNSELQGKKNGTNLLFSDLSQEVNVLKDEPDPRIRVTAYRALKNDSGSLLKYASIAVDDPSPQVRREVAISLRDVPWKESGPLIKKLYKGYDGKDKWYLEALGMATDGKEEAAYVGLLPDQPKDPANWSDTFASLAWRIHPKAAIAALKERALAESVPDSLKSRVVDALAFIDDKDAVKAMFDLKDSAKDDTVRKLAGWWLDFRKTNNWYALWDWQAESGETFDIPEDITKLKKTLLDKNVPVAERIKAGNEMAGSLIGGRLLISLAVEDQLYKPIIDGVSKAIFDSPGLEVRTLARGYFNKPQEKEYSVPDILKLKGDAAHGETVFMGNCIICHKNGTVGNDIGPDLSSIGQKFDRTAMLDAIIHPNASIVFGYRPVMIKTKGGQAFYGFLLSEGETSVLKDMVGRKVVIPSDDIESKVEMKTGIMPTAASLGLTDQNLAYLSTYLLTLKNSSL